MKFTTGIFFFVLLSICYVSNAQKAFDQVRNLIVNLQKSNVADQVQADAREKNERAWCKVEIAKAQALLARRTHDVESLKKHIDYLVNTRTQARKDRKTRVDRIAANHALVAKFKKQRCDNNLLFVKQLKEHMQAIQIMQLLRGDIVAYFNKKGKGLTGAFIEQFEEFAVLLDDEHKQIFTELKTEVEAFRAHRLDRKAETQIKTRSNKSINAEGDRLTAQKARTEKQIGVGHVDNKRGALQRLKTPGYEKISDFNRRVRAKVLGMIDGLVAHLRASRKKLTQDEIKAAEDFAVFQDSTEKENEYLEEKIKQLTAEIDSLTNQIRVSRIQLAKRIKLRDEAAAQLRLLQKMCAEKFAYFKAERTRRERENRVMAKALTLFNNILSKLSSRVRARASTHSESGKTFGSDLAARVVKSEPGVSSGVSSRVKVRNEVVF